MIIEDRSNTNLLADKSRPKYERHLSRDDVGNQARVLLSQFIHDRLQADHSPARLSTNEFVQPGTPTGMYLVGEWVGGKVGGWEGGWEGGWVGG